MKNIRILSLTVTFSLFTSPATGPGAVLLQILRQSPDRGDTDGRFLAGGREPAEGFLLPSQPLRSLQKLTRTQTQKLTQLPKRARLLPARGVSL